MTLQATFSLTPRESYYSEVGGQGAYLIIYGARFYAKYHQGYRYSFDEQHANDRLYFRSSDAADPALDYSTWTNRRTAPQIELAYDLSSLGVAKELALIFGFDAETESRLLIYTSSGLVSDETLLPGDDQFLLEVDSLDRLNLYFIHARKDGLTYYGGGNWFFKGISGYVI